MFGVGWLAFGVGPLGGGLSEGSGFFVLVGRVSELGLLVLDADSQSTLGLV
jgi:hypothetical protein